MARDFVNDLIDELCYDGKGKDRKFDFHKAFRILDANGRKEVTEKCKAQNMSAGHTSMQLANVLRGIARRDGEFVVYRGRSKEVVKASDEWRAEQRARFGGGPQALAA